jgi:hypothetical protein
MRRNGWADDETAADMAYKAAGEIMTADGIAKILQRAAG